MSRFRFFRKVLSDLVFMTIVIGYLIFAPVVLYGLRMAKGQLSIVLNTREIVYVISDPAVPDSVKEKLQLIEEIRRFAFDSIGLKPNENYTEFYDQKGKRLIYVVTACEPFALKPHLWHFPVLGEVPYKGFFDKEKAEKQERELKLEGFDTDIGGASGWSTLGWFKDPVLSQMLNYKEGDLAELIIHELTHGTIFVKDSVDYNENLASFIGYKGALWFLKNKYGEYSYEYLDYIDDRRDEKLLTDFMLHCAHSLDSMYNHIPAGSSLQTKLKLKNEIFGQFVQDAKKLPMTNDSLFPIRFGKRLNKSGNTVFMHYVRYESKQTNFETEYARFGNLNAYLVWLRKKYGSE